MDKATIVLHLSLIDGIGPVAIQRILRSLNPKESLSSLYALSVSQVHFRTGLSLNAAERLVKGLADTVRLEQELALIKQHAFSWTTVLSDDYPEHLKQIYAPPAVLYWRGTLPMHYKTLGVVGARKADWYGKKIVCALLPDMIERGWVIVSGGARGADSMAHRATVEHGGVTVAVLGSGLLRPYPVENKSLFDAIVAKGGAILSAFPLLEEARPGNFPARNRIIAGLSKGVLVVQAARKSGALITARYALEQGRDIFAVPGAFGDLLSEGCHELIKQGATLVASAKDLCEVLSDTSISLAQVGNAQEAQNEHSYDDGDHGTIVRCCSQPMTIDGLVHETGLSVQQVYATLFDLQLQGVVLQNAVGMWQRA